MTLADLRAEFRAETPLALHGHGAAHAGGDRDADEGGIGRPFTGPMISILSHRDWYNGQFLAREALLEVCDWCHARHYNHRIPGYSKPLCGLLIFLAVRLGQNERDIAWLTGIAEWRIHTLLLGALKYADSWRHEQRHRQMRIVYEAERDSLIHCPEPGCQVGTVIAQRRRAG